MTKLVQDINQKIVGEISNGIQIKEVMLACTIEWIEKKNHSPDGCILENFITFAVLQFTYRHRKRAS